ncbi:mannose-1-phosphate guanylyltransferase [Candidatus Roizmanbacteria bacterium]|nr:mannose-1-phosphate guanylyltransferase [Candidatus Roizmanbacteria bacterium]
MKAVIFAGGVGTRLWPLSRKKSPKQFEKIVGEKSTLQLAVDRLLPEFKPEDIYISTGAAYVELVAHQISYIPADNIIGEPLKRDNGPAVAYVIAYLEKKFPDEPVIILWSDHIVKEEQKFKNILQASEKLIRKDGDKIIFIGQKPRFASENLGWIEVGATEIEENNIVFHKFAGFKYKPDKELAQQYFSSNGYCWNLGYFVSTPRFLMGLFKRFTPTIYSLTQNILSHLETAEFEEQFKTLYGEMPEINLDNAILEQLDKEYAYVVVEDIGWSDVGAWEALKEALEEKREDNITKGKVLLEDSSDNLVYNYNGKKLIVGVDLNDLLIVNTDDVLLVASKSSVSKIKKLVEKFQGTEHEQLT